MAENTPNKFFKRWSALHGVFSPHFKNDIGKIACDGRR